MSLFGNVSFRVTPHVAPSPNTAAGQDAAAASRTSSHLEMGTTEALQAAQNALTSKALTKAPKGRKTDQVGRRRQKLSKRERNEILAFVRRVVESMLPTEDKIRLILHVEEEYFKTEEAVRSEFIQSMIALVDDLEAGLDESQRNHADDREEVIAAVRLGELFVSQDKPSQPGQPPPSAGHIDTVA